MTISREAFLRNLPGAVAHAPYRAQGDEFVHEDTGRGWRIRCSRLPDRKIASLVLERHAVEIHLTGYDAAGSGRSSIGSNSTSGVAGDERRASADEAGERMDSAIAGSTSVTARRPS